MDDKTCHFTSFLTAFQSYPDDGRVVIKAVFNGTLIMFGKNSDQPDSSQRSLDLQATELP